MGRGIGGVKRNVSIAALNLNDSGIDVIVGLYKGSKSIELVKKMD